MQNKELQVRTLFEKMLEEAATYARTYDHYAKDMKDFSARVQWRFGPIKGYQIFQGTEYSYKTDEEIENPDITITCDDLVFARQFLRNELDDFRDLLKGDFEITTTEAAEFTVGQLSPLQKTGALLSRIPAFRYLTEKTQGLGHSTTVVIPINKSLGGYQNQTLPLAVLEYFINKTKYIFLYDVCPCRENKDCQDHDHHQFGCMLLGRGILRIKPDLPGHRATKEEALERARAAVADGLVPGFGRLREDAINRIGGPVPDTGDLFNLCYCCPCCCVIGGLKNSPSYMREIYKRFEGLTVSIDKDLCNDCGKCVEVCAFGGLEMADGNLVMDPEKCFGCGRCERVCPTGATTISLEEGSVEKMIARIEEHVDVT